jgi:pyruvate dehydrogenase E2 component (dihydrolipoamide acetyltransferase)
MGEFRMPSLGADMDEGTLVEWRVGVGDHVRRGDIVAVVDTDKATIDVEVFETGIVEHLLVEAGVRVPVGTPLARITPDSAARPATATSATPPTVEPRPGPSPSATPPESTQPEWTPVSVPVSGGPGRHQASVVLSPVVRRLAEARHVDLRDVIGSGPGHRVTRADVERAASSRAMAVRGGTRASPRARRTAAERGIDLAGIRGTGPAGAVLERDVPTRSAAVPAPSDRRTTARQATARSMERANREIPHYHLAMTVDLEPALVWLDERNAGQVPAQRMIPAVLLLRAVALAALEVPEVNGWWADGDLHRADGVDLGVAVALRGGGILTPTLARADLMSLAELMAGLRDVVERVRRGSPRSSDLAPASITVTNLGDRGAELVHGVIHPPQVALVGFGRVAARPVVHEGEVVARRVVTATLAGDHRASDGHLGSRFLAGVERLLSNPARLDMAGTSDDPSPPTRQGGPAHGS